MTDINTFTFIGNLGTAPELSYTATGTAIAKFPMALTRHYQGGDGQNAEKTSWVNITAWGRQAENVAKFLDKGSKVGVKGYVDQSTWTGKDGQKKYAINFVSENIQFLSTKNQGQGQAPRQAQASRQAPRQGQTGRKPYQPKGSSTLSQSAGNEQGADDLEGVPF